MNEKMTNEEVKAALKILEAKKEVRKLSQKVKDILAWVGYLLSALGMIGYFATILTLVLGVGELELEVFGKDGIFFIIGLAFGLFIRTGFYIQGISYAKQEHENILKEYHNEKVKDEKEVTRKSFEFKMLIEVTISTALQVAMFFLSTIGFVYLAGFAGIRNPIYIGNAISNLFMFTGFGLLSLNSAYEKYILYKIPIIKERLRKIKEKGEQSDEVIENAEDDHGGVVATVTVSNGAFSHIEAEPHF